MGDTLQSFYFSPREPAQNGLIRGVGPSFKLATGDDGPTSNKTSTGITAVFLKQKTPSTFGLYIGP